MASLFITFPKKPSNHKRLKPSIDYFQENKAGYGFFVYKIGNSLPKEIVKGEKCFIGFDNKVQGYMFFEKAEFVSKKRAKPFGDWDGSEGNFLICDFHSFKKLNNQVYLRGFPSFRYYDDEKRRRNIISKK